MTPLKRHLLELVLLSWALLAPAHTAIATVLALPLIDLCLALAVAAKTRQPVTSGGLKRTVGKLLVYETATILAFVTEQYLTGPSVPAMRFVTGLIGVTELKSCLEHLDTLSGTSLLKVVVDKLTNKPPEDPNAR